MSKPSRRLRPVKKFNNRAAIRADPYRRLEKPFALKIKYLRIQGDAGWQM
jgi:hypothetical protein